MNRRTRELRPPPPAPIAFMEANQVGHFKPKKRAGDKPTDYPRETLRGVTKKDGCQWDSNWQYLGEVELISIPQDTPYGELLCDLQTRETYYAAHNMEYDGVKYVVLIGSGWMGVGWPFNSLDFDPKNPYEEHEYRVVGLRGDAANNFREICAEDRIPTWEFIQPDQKDLVLFD